MQPGKGIADNILRVHVLISPTIIKDFVIYLYNIFPVKGFVKTSIIGMVIIQFYNNKSQTNIADF